MKEKSNERSDEDQVGSDDRREFAIELHSQRYNQAAETAISTLRLNFVVLAIYVPLVALLEDTDFSIMNIFSNEITQIGFIFWLAASVSAIHTHHEAKKHQWELLQVFNSEDGLATNEEFRTDIDYFLRGVSRGTSISRNVTVTLCLSFATIVALAYGILYPVANFSQGDIFFLSLLVVMAWIYSIGILEVFIRIMRLVFNPREYVGEHIINVKERTIRLTGSISASYHRIKVDDKEDGEEVEFSEREITDNKVDREVLISANIQCLLTEGYRR